MDTKSSYSKEFLVKELVSLFTDSNIAITAAGGIFTFKYGHYVVDKYTPKELMEAAHNADSQVKTRYVAELNAAFLMFRYFKKHPDEFELGKQKTEPRNYSINLTHSPSPFPYLTAIRTKPFLLLAGISGTGKSRIVREFAFKSCPKYLQDEAGTTPGNYCMIEVKPNWHDSTELLGYYSRLGKAGYQFTKFVKFLVKAKMFPKVPFFVCLDEMNLAPVEQYFAEVLSILETRKHPKHPECGQGGYDARKDRAHHRRAVFPRTIRNAPRKACGNRTALQQPSDR